MTISFAVRANYLNFLAQLLCPQGRSKRYTKLSNCKLAKAFKLVFQITSLAKILEITNFRYHKLGASTRRKYSIFFFGSLEKRLIRSFEMMFIEFLSVH